MNTNIYSNTVVGGVIGEFNNLKSLSAFAPLREPFFEFERLDESLRRCVK